MPRKLPNVHMYIPMHLGSRRGALILSCSVETSLCVGYQPCRQEPQPAGAHGGSHGCLWTLYMHKYCIGVQLGFFAAPAWVSWACSWRCMRPLGWLTPSSLELSRACSSLSMGCEEGVLAFVCQTGIRNDFRSSGYWWVPRWFLHAENSTHAQLLSCCLGACAVI